MSKAGSNRLPILAAAIRAAQADVQRASKLSAEHAVDTGRLLAEAKADEGIPRGGWKQWVEQIAGVPQRTANHYIQLYVAVSEQRLTLGDIAEVGQVAALKAVRASRRRRGR
jgi:hypothetical protein